MNFCAGNRQRISPIRIFNARGGIWALHCPRGPLHRHWSAEESLAQILPQCRSLRAKQQRKCFVLFSTCLLTCIVWFSAMGQLRPSNVQAVSDHQLKLSSDGIFKINGAKPTPARPTTTSPNLLSDPATANRLPAYDEGQAWGLEAPAIWGHPGAISRDHSQPAFSIPSGGGTVERIAGVFPQLQQQQIPFRKKRFLDFYCGGHRWIVAIVGTCNRRPRGPRKSSRPDIVIPACSDWDDDVLPAL